MFLLSEKTETTVSLAYVSLACCGDKNKGAIVDLLRSENVLAAPFTH